jgi:predicted kinase
MSDREKKIVIIGGPNGAGKTTFAREFLPHEAGLPVFVNADLIAAGLSPFNPEAAAFRAGRLMLEEIAAHTAAGRSFAFESTLSGLTYLQMIAAWRASGYIVKLMFLSLATPEEAIARVAMRVRQGGHDVPALRSADASPRGCTTSHASTVNASTIGNGSITAALHRSSSRKAASHDQNARIEASGRRYAGRTQGPAARGTARASDCAADRHGRHRH